MDIFCKEVTNSYQKEENCEDEVTNHLHSVISFNINITRQKSMGVQRRHLVPHPRMNNSAIGLPGFEHQKL